VQALLGLQPRNSNGYRYAPEEFVHRINELEAAANEARQISANKRSAFQQKVTEVAEHVQLYVQLAGLLENGKLVTPATSGGEWRKLPQTLREEAGAGKDEGPAHSLASILGAYAKNRPLEFNQELETYGDQVPNLLQAHRLNKANFEFSLNSFEPYYHCMILY